MSTVTFDEDDVGKRVVNADGEDIGMIVDVRHGTPYVDPNPGTWEKMKAKLGWTDDEDEEEYPLQDDQVAEVTDDEVHLQSM